MYKVYDRGDPVLTKMEVERWKEKDVYEHADPDSITIKISKNGVVKVNNADMTKQNGYTGFYYHIWQSKQDDELGEYDVEITTTFGAYTELSKGVIVLK